MDFGVRVEDSGFRVWFTGYVYGRGVRVKVEGLELGMGCGLGFRDSD